MPDYPEKLTGGCLCGALRFQTSKKPFKVSYCHCESCRRASASPVMAIILYYKGAVTFTQGEPKWYESSPGVFRGHCDTCGTPISWQGVWHDVPIEEIYISTLDDPESVQPDRHAFIEEKLSWFDVEDDLFRFSGTSPEK
ncbi:MAG: hypothetical protein ACI9FD_000707 [Gammaproteobacteria bacterium]|jgi:hypothetical protein